MVDLSVVIVNWNVREFLSRCLSALFANSSDCPELEVIVVDNASGDGSLDMLQTAFDDVRVIANPSNLGFARACNQGWSASRGRHVLFLNPDTEILGDALATMVQYLDAHPEVHCLGPQLQNGDGTIQSSRRRFPSLATALFESTLLERWWPENPWALRYRHTDTADDLEQEVDWLVGACLLVTADALARTGGFDEAFFMYSEEMDLCRRVRSSGGKVVYLPTAQVIHHEGKSSEQVVAVRHALFHTSKVRYFRKHHGKLVAGVLRLFLTGTYVYQSAEEGFKWLLGHKRSLRGARVRAYGEVIRALLLPAERVP